MAGNALIQATFRGLRNRMNHHRRSLSQPSDPRCPYRFASAMVRLHWGRTQRLRPVRSTMISRRDTMSYRQYHALERWRCQWRSCAAIHASITCGGAIWCATPIHGPDAHTSMDPRNIVDDTGVIRDRIAR